MSKVSVARIPAACVARRLWMSVPWAVTVLVAAAALVVAPRPVAAQQSSSSVRGAQRPAPTGGAPLVGTVDHTDALRGPVTRELLVRMATERSPALRASRLRAHAMALDGDVEARLPPPMAEVQVWQVPVTRPYAVDRAGMIMAGIKQDFPSASVRHARRRAAELDANVEAIMTVEQRLLLAAEVEHAFTEYVEAFELVRIHERHRAAAERVMTYARARLATLGSLSEMAKAEGEVAMIETALAAARSRIEVARARVNGLLLRPSNAPLGAPVPWASSHAREDTRRLLVEAEAARPELRVARAKREAAQAGADAESRIAELPMLSAGLYYFTPTESMAEHGFGVSLSTTLPWLWGAPAARSRAARAQVDAADAEEEAARAQIAREVATLAAEVEARTVRLHAIESIALPAKRRLEQATLAGYESSRAELLEFLMARTALVNTEVEAVTARAELEHALTDLRWAVGRSGSPEKGTVR